MKKHRKQIFIGLAVLLGAAVATLTMCKPEEKEQARWYNAIRNDIDPVVTPEQAIVVTQILEAIYTSAKTGTIYNF